MQLLKMDGCPQRTCDNGYTSIHEAARNACSNALEALIVYGKTKTQRFFKVSTFTIVFLLFY